MTQRPFLPYGRQQLTADDIQAVTDVLKGDYWTTGPAIGAFEDAFSAQCGGVEAIAVSNGTTALHLAAIGAGVGPGSLVIVPDITFVASANGARYLGAEVILSDVEPNTGLMGPEQLSAALDQARAPVACVVVVHLAGQSADMQALRRVLDAHPNGKEARLIEDACHAVGTIAQGGHPMGACAFSDFATFSFHPVKTVAAGEGGMITCRDPKIAARLRLLRSHGITRDPSQFQNTDAAFDKNGAANPWYYEAIELGYNYRLTDIQAALGASQLSRLAQFKSHRASLAARYDARLAQMPDLITPTARKEGCDPCWHLYVALIDFARLGMERADVMNALRAAQIGSQVHYVPLHAQPALAQGASPRVIHPVATTGADHYYARCLSLPLFQDMGLADVDYVCDTLFDLIHTAT